MVVTIDVAYCFCLFCSHAWTQDRDTRPEHHPERRHGWVARRSAAPAP
jgi:hypothetical protein